MFGNIYETFNWNLKVPWKVHLSRGIESSTPHFSKDLQRGDFEIIWWAKKILIAFQFMQIPMFLMQLISLENTDPVDFIR